MTDKEIGEIRRRFKKDKCNVECIYGCLVSEKKEIAASFRVPLALIPADDAEMVLTLMRKALSGTAGRNVNPLPFTNEQVMDSPEHKLLMTAQNVSDEGDEAIAELFVKMAENIVFDGSYLLLLARDVYDIPAYGKDGEKAEESENIFRYILCCMCPLKDTKANLGFFPSENTFKSVMGNRVIASPEIGFMFPSFTGRNADIYELTYYTRSTQTNQSQLIENVFHTGVPMPADSQKETFGSILAETLSEDCNMKVAMAVRDSICDRIAEYKADRQAEDMPVISKQNVKRVLEDCGVSPERVQAFENKYTDSFGERAEIAPQNLVDIKKIDINTPDVSIQVNNDRSDLVKTQMIDGVRYILIRAENGVEVNGWTVT